MDTVWLVTLGMFDGDEWHDEHQLVVATERLIPDAFRELVATTTSTVDAWKPHHTPRHYYWEHRTPHILQSITAHPLPFRS